VEQEVQLRKAGKKRRAARTDFDAHSTQPADEEVGLRQSLHCFQAEHEELRGNVSDAVER
jgi:hypothetical protein